MNPWCRFRASSSDDRERPVQQEHRLTSLIYRAVRAVASPSHNDVMTDREDARMTVHEELPAGWSLRLTQ